MENYKLSKTEKGLAEKRIVAIGGRIDPSMVGYVYHALAKLIAEGSPKIQIRITSDGGDVTTALEIYDLLRLYPGKKVGLVIGWCWSMATIILQACDQRLCAEHATIKIHNIKINIGGMSLDILRNKKLLGRELTEAEKAQKPLYKILAGKTKKSIPVIRKLCAKDQILSAGEALKFGLIDKII